MSKALRTMELGVKMHASSHIDSQTAACFGSFGLVLWLANGHRYYIINFKSFSCQERQGVSADKLQVQAATVLSNQTAPRKQGPTRSPCICLNGM